MEETMSGHNHPFDEVAKLAHMRIMEGHTIYQKFTCEKCGTRQTIDVPNTCYVYGSCEECRHITDIRKTGCNYMLVTGLLWTADELLAEQERSAKEVAERGRKQ